MASEAMFLRSQWIADQGFCRGRGGRTRNAGSWRWEREIHGDLATVPLQDQVDALEAVAAENRSLDLSRVGIMGWSFGGYLSLLAILRRPDMFKAAVAGAPVTDWTLYDTHYTERYLGLPETNPGSYERSSVLEDAPSLAGKLLLLHGLADDNVFVAHSLRLSRRMFLADRPHVLLPLSGLTHMAADPGAAESLLNMQVSFLREALRSQ